MISKRALCALLFSLVILSYSDSYAQWFFSSKKSRIEGDWARLSDNTVFKFQKGLMVYHHSGSIFATYEFVDKDTIRFKLDDEDTHWDFLVFIEFPSDKEMVWYRIFGGDKRQWFQFIK